jgi:predicted dehydrogenase
VLGAGSWIAGRAVVPAIQRSGNGRLEAVASRNHADARRLAASTGARAGESYEALLSDPQVDAVYIPLVNSVHKEWTLRALAARKHVLCEKPLGMNATEAEEMSAAAESSGMHLMEAFMYRFNPRVRDFVGRLRDVLHVQASFGFRLASPSNYRWRPELGGGALLDVGCYGVNVARWILGEPEDVLARARTKGVDMTVSALLQFSGGRTASIWASFESPEEQDLTVVTESEVHRLEKPFTAMKNANPYQLMVESFGDSVLQDRPVAIAPAESIANMKVLDRIRGSARI